MKGSFCSGPKEARPQLEHPVTSPEPNTNQPDGRAGARGRALGDAGQDLMMQHIWEGMEVFTYFKAAARRRE